MNTKQKDINSNWKMVGGPQAGSIAALAIGFDGEIKVFAGTSVGIFRSTHVVDGNIQGWSRLIEAPVGVMSIGVSPAFLEDKTVVVGTHAGIFTSYDAGNTWRLGKIPLSHSMVLSINFSPDYVVDGIVFAGTLEDGVFYTNNRGSDWYSKDFGLLDPSVLAMAISPNFAQDEIIFAGTDTGLFYSYNGARAWREMGFPENTAPVLSMVISPDFSNDGTVFAGTEENGIYRTLDKGIKWEQLKLPATCVNALAISPGYRENKFVFAATENGVFKSSNGGKTWKLLVDLPDAISLAHQDDLTLVGLVNEGVFSSKDLKNWKPVANMAARSFTGFVISPDFEINNEAYIFGPQEGLWRTDDKGITWTDLNETVPSLDISTVLYGVGNRIIVSSPDGIFITTDHGQTWETCTSEPAGVIVQSPNLNLLAAGFLGEGLRLSEDGGKSWNSVIGPWDVGGTILAMSVGNNQYLHVAFLEPSGDSLSIWQGHHEQWNKVLSQTVAPNPVISFWIPPEPMADRPWFAAIENKVWRFSSRADAPRTQSPVINTDGEKEIVLTLTGHQNQNGQMLIATTGQRLYRTLDMKTWSLVHDFGSDRSLALILSPAYETNKKAYALTLGGMFWQGSVR